MVSRANHSAPPVAAKATESTLLAWLKETLYDAPPLRELRERLRTGGEGTAVEFTRAPGSLVPVVAAALAEGDGLPVLLVSPDARAAEKARDDLRTLLGAEAAWLLPQRDAIPYDPLHQNPRFDERAGAFERLVSREFSVLITFPAALVERLETLAAEARRLVRFRVGDPIDREALALVLGEAGMRREVRAEEPGQFAVRGAVVDIYPPASELPVRLELWGDEISELRAYDPATQRSLEHLGEVRFYAGEEGEEGREAALWELLPPGAVLLLDDPDALRAGLERTWEEIEYQFEKRRELELDRRTPRPDERYVRPDAVFAALAAFPRAVHRGPAAPTAGSLDFGARAHESYLGDLRHLAADLRHLRKQRLETVVLCERAGQVDRLSDLLEEQGAGGVLPRIGIGPLHEGFTWPAAGIALLTDHQIFGRHRRTGAFRRRKRRVDPAAFEQLKRGDIVVHTDFGIGRYLGLKKITVRDAEQECLQIEYRDGVKVYVRLDQFSKLQKYQGTDGAPPKFSRIGGLDWDRARRRAREAVEELARDILELYARRQVEGGHAFTPDTPWQREMEAAFEFEDTPDQAAAALAVKQDMEKPIAMDRLLLGDVGFGKTEVAVRAAFKAVQDSRQVAVLVPTTILAQQHYATFSERLLRYPVRIEVLSRFRTRAEQKAVLDGLAAGEVDIVIGTHRLLSKDVKFRRLGLIIVDEEHRFGVKHKDTLKRLRPTVDVLTLSATPIPRTLHMAMSGVRDLSMISTPPHDRQPIETEITPFDPRIIREAILREVARGGQVYFIHNRVQSIHAIRKMLERLLPGISFAVAHGQMKERDLDQVMQDFLHQRYQVLICTMIIESGLDIPNVNTLIVNRADRLGLAQLYQVRGRIGRSHRQAYAYLLTPPRMLLQNDARRRLETIAEHTRLGSGFQIAMRDLEIRGAGNLLGSEQSGFINQVGLELYTQMLAEAVQALKEEGVAKLPEAPVPRRDSREVKVDAPVDAMLPPVYVSDPAERVEIYRRLSRTQDPEEVRDLRSELRDRFGPLPPEGEHLLEIVEVQAEGARAGVTRVELHENVAFFEFASDWGREDFQGRLSTLLAALQDHPIEFKGTGSALGLRLALEDCDGWPDRWARVKEALRAVPVEVA